MLAWRTELEQSEVRAEAALLTILSLTQITELKLLLDVGPTGHRFYGLVLGLLLSAISLEVLVGAVIIYVGGIHRSRPPRSPASVDEDLLTAGSRCGRLRRAWRRGVCCWCCCCCRRRPLNRRPARCRDDYGLQDPSGLASGAAQELLPSQSGHRGRVLDDPATSGGSNCCCCLWSRDVARPPSVGGAGSIALKALRETDGDAAGPGAGGALPPLASESAAVRLADVDFRIARARGRVDSLEGAVKRGAATAAELDAARRELSRTVRMRGDADTDRKLAEMRDRRNAQLVELMESRRQAALFVRVAAWQNVVTYLVYVIMLLNVVITTFGMSGEAGTTAASNGHHVLSTLKKTFGH